MGIYHLNGSRLKHAVIAAAQRVLESQERLNNINVFPVPDGDTGTNMALTLKSVAQGALQTKKTSLSELSSRLADSALMGARGNSGAVLAQFFQGMAEGFAGFRRIGPGDFAACMGSAVRSAECAFVDPREGTILTVMRDWADHLRTRVNGKKEFRSLLRESLRAASDSLRDTPKKLEVLAAAGVVDAGAQGFVHMLEGVVDFIETGKIRREETERTRVVEKAAEADFKQSGNAIGYRYCTECLIEGDSLDAASVRASVASLGDSLVVTGHTAKVRLHIHTDEPQTLFEQAMRHGSVSHRKYDDMRARNRGRWGSQRAADIALITDSSCDLSMEYLIEQKVHVVPVSVSFGSRTYIDRVTITCDQVYRMMVEGGVQPRTSQPAHGDFLQVYARAAETHGSAVVILLASALSGTYQAGLTAAKSQTHLNMRVIDAKTGAASMGFLVQIAAEAIAAGCALEEVCRRVEAARTHARIFLSIESLDYLVRGGRVSRLKNAIARMMNLVPILTLSDEGKVKILDKAHPGKASRQRLVKIVEKHARHLTHTRFVVCHAGAAAQAREVADALCPRLKLDSMEILPVSPTVGTHLGPGTVAVAVMGFPEGGPPW